MDYFNKKYSLSQQGFQCLGSCYNPGTWIVHPTTLEHVTELTNPFCPVNEWLYTDPTTKKTEKKITDGCKKGIKPISIQDSKELEMNIITPNLHFTCDHFLKIYYNIYSLEDCTNWLDENEFAPYYTKKRIIDCTWKTYGFESIIPNDRLIQFYTGLLKTRWMGEIYNRFGKYINYHNNQLSVKGDNNKVSEKDIKIAKINFIVDKFITYKDVHKFMHKYIETFKKSKDKISSHTDNIKKEYKQYIKKKIREYNN